MFNRKRVPVRVLFQDQAPNPVLIKKKISYPTDTTWVDLLDLENESKPVKFYLFGDSNPTYSCCWIEVSI